MVRRALIGAIVATFGIAAPLGVGYPAGAKPAKGHHTHCAGAAKSKAKHAKRHAECKKAQKHPHGTTLHARHSVSPAAPQPATPTLTTPADTTPPPTAPTVSTPASAIPPPTTPAPTVPTTPAPPPEAPSATLAVEVEGCGGPPPGGCEALKNPVRVTRIGSEDGASIIETSEHAFRVVPGLYEVTVEAGSASQSKQVEVSAGPETVVSFLIEEL